jgi:Family of unknown function (DUF6356)
MSTMVSRVIDRYFLEHPRSAGQRYFEHLRFAWRFGATMFAGACAAFIHGVLPTVHQTTASRRVNELHARLKSRHKDQ